MVGIIWIGIIISVVVMFILVGLRIVKEWETGLVFTFGKFAGERSPGLTWIIPIVQTITSIDKRVRTIDVEPQECITSDSVTIELDAVIYYQVINPISAVIKVRDFREASYKLGQTALRDAVGKRDLDELLQKKDEIGKEVMSIIQGPTDGWGVKITNVEIKDVILPKNMKRSMAKEAEAIREKRARITKAEAELEASKKLKQASTIMDDNALILRQLQTWQEIGAEQNSTMILVPSELISKFTKK